MEITLIKTELLPLASAESDQQEPADQQTRAQQANAEDALSEEKEAESDSQNDAELPECHDVARPRA